MTVFIYERVLQLLEAEGINTLFGIPDPSFSHVCHRRKARLANHCPATTNRLARLWPKPCGA
jgi:hypothetical protein